MLQRLALRRIVLEVDERDPALERDGLLDAVDAAEHRLVLHLDAAFHVHALVQQRALPPRGQLLHALHQRVAFTLREEAGALHRIHQQLQFGERERAVLHGVLHRRALVGAHVHAELAQRLDVAVDGLALGRDAQRFQLPDDLRHREAAFGIGLLLEHPHEVQQLELLTIDGHGPSLATTVQLACHALSIAALSFFRYRQSMNDLDGFAGMQ